MFIFDFVAETILDQILDWIYGKIIGFLNDFFVMMNNMGVELFELPWVNAVTTFFSYLGWALFGVGLVVGAFECAIEYQGGRGSIKDTAMNYIKGFMAVSLFTVVPVNLYSLCVSLQGTFGSAITGITNAESIGLTAQQVLMSASFPGIGNPILMTFCAVMMGYAVIKVFFANLKRGGILLIQIAVGSLYMFSVPRGYIDGFIQWCKQVIGICITAFLQSTILTAGLIIKKAYRKAAKECHPDTHPGDKRAEERFKEIGEAYRILSDKQKRKEYDARAAQRERESATGRYSAQTGRRSAGGSIYPGDIEKEFERFFSKGVQSEKKENSSQQKINPMDVTDLFERYMGFKH